MTWSVGGQANLGHGVDWGWNTMAGLGLERLRYGFVAMFTGNAEMDFNYSRDSNEEIHGELYLTR